MPLCRLCGQEKSSEEIVISLLEQFQLLSFLEVVEYFSRVTLDKDPSKPQGVCGKCKKIVRDFAEFSYEMEKQQLKFVKVDQSTDNNVKEPEIKKQKLTKDNSLEVVDIVKDKDEPATDKNVVTIQNTTGGLRKRCRSVVFTESISHLLATENTVSCYFEDVEKIFGKLTPAKIKLFEKIEIDDSELLAEGEVPVKWLQQFKDFTTWKDMKFSCRGHCKKKFQNLYDLLIHNGEYIKLKDNQLACLLCESVFKNRNYLASFINHMARTHYAYIKFCCIVCSKVYKNMHYLIKHYQQHHPNEQFLLYPCLECGLYCQAIYQLKIHQKVHVIK